MNNFHGVFLIAQANGTDLTGFLALLTVQFIGALLALRMTLAMKDAYNGIISDDRYSRMQNVVWVVIAITVGIALFHKGFATLLLQGIGGSQIELNSYCIFDLKNAHLIYFLADFGALAYLIYSTGGPQQSLYTTFLLVIVPISIALGNPGLWTVGIFAVITLIIFLTLLWIKPPEEFRDSHRGGLAPKRWIAAVTSACIVFPTLVFFAQNIGSSSSASGATTQQNSIDTKLSLPVDHTRESVAGVTP